MNKKHKPILNDIREIFREDNVGYREILAFDNEENMGVYRFKIPIITEKMRHCSAGALLKLCGYEVKCKI